MRYSKMLGLVGLAAVALMAFAGFASATALTSPVGTTYTGTIKGESEGATSFHGPFYSVTCAKSNFEGFVEVHGSGKPVIIPLTYMAFEGCNMPIKMITNGRLEVHENGTVTWTGSQFTVYDAWDCSFATAFSDIGTLTTTKATGADATLDLNETKLKPTSFMCGPTWTWTGSYKIAVPNKLWVD